jgi:hypothetical protein
MYQVCFSRLSFFFLTTPSFVDRLELVGRLLRVSTADAVLVARVATRSLPVFRQSKIRFRPLAACLVCAVSFLLVGPSWANPTAVSEQIAEELERHLVPSAVVEDRHAMVGDASLLVGTVDDSISQAPMPQVPADLLAEPADSESEFRPIPEPSSLALLGGLGGLMFFIHRVRAYFDRSAVR